MKWSEPGCPGSYQGMVLMCSLHDDGWWWLQRETVWGPCWGWHTVLLAYTKLLLVFTPVCPWKHLYIGLSISKALLEEPGRWVICTWGTENWRSCKSPSRWESWSFILMSCIIKVSFTFSGGSLTHKTQTWPLIKKAWDYAFWMFEWYYQK